MLNELLGPYPRRKQLVLIVCDIGIDRILRAAYRRGMIVRISTGFSRLFPRGFVRGVSWQNN